MFSDPKTIIKGDAVQHETDRLLVNWVDNGATKEERRLRKVIACAAMRMDRPSCHNPRHDNTC